MKTYTHAQVKHLLENARELDRAELKKAEDKLRRIKKAARYVLDHAEGFDRLRIEIEKD